jgi:hypothetical protein
MAAFHLRRDKAALFQRVQGPPGDRSRWKRDIGTPPTSGDRM